MPLSVSCSSSLYCRTAEEGKGWGEGGRGGGGEPCNMCQYMPCTPTQRVAMLSLHCEDGTVEDATPASLWTDDRIGRTGQWVGGAR